MIAERYFGVEVLTPVESWFREICRPTLSSQACRSLQPQPLHGLTPNASKISDSQPPGSYQYGQLLHRPGYNFRPTGTQ